MILGLLQASSGHYDLFCDSAWVQPSWVCQLRLILNLFRPLSDRHHGLTTNDAIQLLVARPLYQNCHL